MGVEEKHLNDSVKIELTEFYETDRRFYPIVIIYINGGVIFE